MDDSMSDEEFSVTVEIPLDSDGFLRRECPSCEGQFKWFSHEDGSEELEHVSQYFCPLCGIGADSDAWWTPEQLTYAQGAAGPELDNAVQAMMKNAFKGLKGISYKENRSFTIGIESTDPPSEPDDMVIVEPPCHPNEPIKVPEEATHAVHCLICGERFAA